MIPIYINNRNRLTTLEGMVEYCSALPYAEVTIVDNGSTYPPLLEWYGRYTGKIIRLENNTGPWAPWIINQRPWGDSRYYVVSDSDLDLSSIPVDFLDVLSGALDQFPHIIKAGPSLETRDMPTPEIQAFVDGCESPYWHTRLSSRFWDAPIDTTFAMYRAGWHSTRQSGHPAARADRPYTAKHIPWYRILDDEERYFEENCDDRWSSTAKAWRGKPPPEIKKLIISGSYKRRGQ